MRSDRNNAETIFETKNKAQAERNFRRLYEVFCSERKGCVYLVNERNFVVEDCFGRQEYWIEKF